MAESRAIGYHAFMTTLQVHLPNEFVPILKELLGPGGWESLEDLVMSGLLRSLDEMRGDDPEWMREAVRLGVEQANRGETVDGPAAVERARRKLLDSRTQPA